MSRSATIHAPIRRGDIPAIVDSAAEPGAIAVIDGIFHSQETLTLVEIRRAIDRGWAMVGCSSMGALRALEAAPLGMQGFGVVYRWLRLYSVEEDDEVAQTMDPDTLEPLSLALVDIRWQVSRLCRMGVLSREQARRVIGAIKSRYYPSRTRLLLTELVAEHAAVQFQLPADTEAPKHRDAVALLRWLNRGRE